MKIFILFVFSLIAIDLYPCPITISNDTGQQIIIVDPRGSEALFLAPNETGMINPTIPNFIMKYLLNEELYFYYPNKTKLGKFYKKYKLTEKYCTDNPKESELTISQIVNFIQNPSNRFKVHVFKTTRKGHDH